METNNKLREALIKIRDLTEPNEGVTEIELIINDIAISALAEPVRNCDVGTAEEQIERWQAFCNRYDDDCTGCPCEAADTWNYTTCFAKWTQLPYEGGEK